MKHRIQFLRRRREFITLVGGAAVAWPLAARAQPDRMRHIGVLMSTASNDPLGKARIAAFLHGLQQLGWTDGRNVRIDTRWGGGNADDIHKYAAELVGIAPDVILASGGSVAGPLLQATRTIPIVFTSTPDPVGAGFVDSLPRPGGNATGFTNLEYGLGAKWLELLKDRTARDASGGPSRSRHSSRDRAVGRHPDSGAVGWDRGEPDQCARSRRDRTHGHRIRAPAEWRPDSVGQRVGARSSRYDHQVGSSAQTARGLLRTLLRHRRRPDLLRG